MAKATTEDRAPMGDGDEAKRRRWRQIAWFVGLWLMSVATVGAVAFLIRWVLVGL